MSAPLAPPETTTPAPRPRKEKPPHRGHVLVVDDIENNRDILVRRLAKEGYTSVQAEDGVLALEAMARESVDLVLLDIQMPNMDGMEVLRRIQAHEEWRHIPVIMISANSDMERVLACIGLGATDFLPKPFDPAMLRARVNASVERKRLHDQHKEHLRVIEESRAALAAELKEASNYVESLLPAPLSGDISTAWRFVPSAQLGGDFLGCHSLDADRLAIYLLDVSGHGVGAALLSVSVVHALRSQNLQDVDFTEPGSVLSALNDSFPMERNNMMYFTAWYGVYDKKKRLLKYASGGHPPAMLLPPGATAASVQRLRTKGLVIGGMPDMPYPQAETEIVAGSTLYVFSDGVYEVTKPAGPQMELDELAELLVELPPPDQAPLDALIERIRRIHGQPEFDDDFSVLSVTFS